jgi:FkbM family methyltransferase
MEINQSPRMTRYVVECGVFRTAPFFLVDVGASGGIDSHWREFGNQLSAVGFDPLIGEVARLNQSEQTASVRYVAAMVGCRSNPETPPGAFQTDTFAGTSTVWARALERMNYTAAVYDQTHSGASTPEMVELDEYFAGQHDAIDFLKTDTDGQDIAVLRGSRKLLSTAGPMALAVEVLFWGAASEATNFFSNVDPYLRDLGYSLFAIEPRFHTRAALPGMFRWNQFADTHTGRACWGNTLFCRDVCLPDYEKRFGIALTPAKLLKLCCVHELYGFPDCAAEVLLQFRDRLQPVVDVDRCLDLLTPPLPDGRRVSYREYIETFRKTPAAFYSGR